MRGEQGLNDSLELAIAQEVRRSSAKEDRLSRPASEGAGFNLLDDAIDGPIDDFAFNREAAEIAIAALLVAERDVDVNGDGQCHLLLAFLETPKVDGNPIGSLEYRLEHRAIGIGVVNV